MGPFYSSGDVDAAASLYERGLEAIPDCVLLHIAYAELEEKRSVPSPTPCRIVAISIGATVGLGQSTTHLSLSSADWPMSLSAGARQSMVLRF